MDIEETEISGMLKIELSFLMRDYNLFREFHDKRSLYHLFFRSGSWDTLSVLFSEFISSNEPFKHVDKMFKNLYGIINSITFNIDDDAELKKFDSLFDMTAQAIYGDDKEAIGKIILADSPESSSTQEQAVDFVKAQFKENLGG